MRARFIYEKFTEDSDPIKDMGIGLITKLTREFIDNNWKYEYSAPKTSFFGQQKYAQPIKRRLREDEVTIDMLFNYCLNERTGKYGLSVIKALIDAGATIDNRSGHFFKAIEKGIDYVKLFIDKGGEIKNINGLCYSAIMGDKLDIAELFVEKGANIKSQANICIRSASKYNLTNAVKWLLDKGANPNVYNYYCLQQALKNKNYELVNIFFKEYEKTQPK